MANFFYNNNDDNDNDGNGDAADDDAVFEIPDDNNEENDNDENERKDHGSASDGSGDDSNDDSDDEGAHEGTEDDENGGDEGADERDISDDDSDDDEAPDTDDQRATDQPRYGLRERTGTARNFKDAMDDPHDGKSYFPPTQLTQAGLVDTIKFIYGKVMTQMTAKKGIKEFGQEAMAALMQEFAQMENLDVYEAVDARLLTRQQRRAALRAINLIKRKRDGTLIGRTVADGSVQRALYDKVEAASPTVATDALLLSILIDAHEGRDVATADVAGAYLKACMTDLVIMKFTGETVDILWKMNPKHSKFVVVQNGVKVLYVKLIKALYGCVKSALLWYELFSTMLEGMCFEINPYDPCIANCKIDDEQCTIAWCVDDTKISHVDQGVVSRVVQQIEGHFGKMTVTRGKEHTFLGMNIEYTNDRKAIISMRNYLEEAIDECGMEIKREVATPARRTLFEVDPKAKLLNKHQAETFHRVVAKLLYVSIRARSDILLSVAFLCTRVSKSTEQDRGMLRRVLEYVKGTLDLTHTLGADNLCKLRTWVDASYAVHPDMRSHTGGIMSFGLGGLIAKSTKHKLNSKSSTEAELIGASDYLPNVIWVKLLMEAQGYRIHEIFLSRTVRVRSNWKRTAEAQQFLSRGTWISDVSGLKIASSSVGSRSDIVPRYRCLRIFLLNLCKARCSVSFEM